MEDKLKKEILEEFDKNAYRGCNDISSHEYKYITEQIKNFLVYTIDRVRAERDKEVEEIPVMKGTNDMLDNITIEKEEEESQIGVSKVETKMEEIVLDNRDENDHEGIQELQIELNELVELAEEEFSLNKIKESPNYSWLKKIADKKIEILINKNIEDELELELDDLIELVEKMEQKKAIDEYRKGYNQRLKDEGKIGEDYQGLYL